MEKRDFSTNATSPLPSSPIQGHEPLILSYHILHLIGGQILLPILLVTLFVGGEARKNPLLANFCFSWILFSATQLILFYGGKQTKETPTIQVCLIQASLNYGMMGMTSITSCAVIIQAWHYLRMSTRPNSSLRIYGWRTTVLMILSYLALVGYSSAGIIIGVNSPEDIGRTHNFFVCDIRGHKLATAAGWLTAFVGFVAFILGIWIIVIIYHNRQTIRYWRLYNTSSDFAMILRTMVFIVYGMMVVIASIVAIYDIDTTFVYMYTAILPIVAFFAFGTRHATTVLWRKWFHIPPPKSRRTTLTQSALNANPIPIRLRTYEPVNTGEDADDDGYWGLAAALRQRPRVPQSRPSEMAVLEEEAEAAGSGSIDGVGGHLLRPKLQPRESSQLAKDSWGYKSFDKKEGTGEGGPILRRGWSQLPEREDLDTPRESSHPHPQHSGSWEELPIRSPTPPPPASQLLSKTNGLIPDGPIDSNLHSNLRPTHLQRPNISSYTSSVSITSTARRIPPPEDMEVEELIPDGDKAKRLRRPADISWTSEPFLPVASRFESPRRHRDEWDGPY